MSDLDDVILLTGASSDLGTAIAIRLAEHSRLILHGRDAGRLERCRISLPTPERHMTWCCDFSGDVDIGESLVSLVYDKRITVSGFVHAAGLFSVSATRLLDMQEVRRVFSVNVFSAIEICRQLARKKINKSALQRIVFISSIASRIGIKGYQAYSASKAALNGLMRSLAVELAPAVRVNSVLPGGIETRGTKAVFSGAAPGDEHVPLGAGASIDIASMVEYLMSEEARWITGQEFVVDGGRTIV